MKTSKSTKKQPPKTDPRVICFKDLLQEKLSWNAARLDCFARLVVAILSQRTVNLVLLAPCVSGEIQSDSAYRRFQRFFATFAMPLLDVGALVKSLLPRCPEGFVLAMDRTNWQFGKTHINILCITAVFGKVGFPLVWKVLPQATKKGNSNSAQRIALMKKLLRLISPAQIAVLTLDREFIGKSWLSWLDDHQIAYVVRLRHNATVGSVKARDLSKRCRWKRFETRRWLVMGQEVYFAAKTMTGQRGGALQVISNRYSGQRALEFYRLRWGIEIFFSHLKKRGLNFEDTHLRDRQRIERLTAVLAVAFTVAYRAGAFCALKKGKAIRRNKHGYRAKSQFRLGLESMIRLLMGQSQKDAQLLRQLIESCFQPNPKIFVV